MPDRVDATTARAAVFLRKSKAVIDEVAFTAIHSLGGFFSSRDVATRLSNIASDCNPKLRQTPKQNISKE
jgi:hypothetical protein